MPIQPDPLAGNHARLALSSAAFVAASLVLVAALVPGAFLRGEVLSQGTLLYEHHPWQAHAPEDAAPANPLLHDAAYLFYPLLTHAVESVRRGELPVWSAALYGGHPFLASFQTALFSPFTWIAFVVPLPHATVFKALAPLVVGGLGMFLFVRSLGLNGAAAWFAGLAYLLNGFGVAWMEHPLTAVACWLPWILLATDEVVKRVDGRRAAWLAALVSLTIFAGHPETTTKVLLLTGAYALAAVVAVVRTRPSARSEHTRLLRRMLLAYAAGALLTAVQVVPFLEYLSQSEALLSREAHSFNTFFLSVKTLITALVPDFFGNPALGAYAAPANRYGVAPNYAEQALYAGIAVFVLAPFGLIGPRADWRPRFFAAAAGLALALMFGLPGVIHAVSTIPFLRVMILTRFGLLVIVSLIVLAAYGVDRLTRQNAFEARSTGRTMIVLAGAVAAALGFAWILGIGFLRAHGLEAIAGRGTGTAFVLLIVVCVLIWMRARRTISPVVFAAAICAVLAGDLVVAGAGFHPTVPARQVYGPVPEIDAIRRDPGLFRVYGWGNALVPNAAMAYGLQDARGWDGMNPDRWTRLLDLGYLRQTADPERHLRDAWILDLLNVKYLFVEPGVKLPAGRYARVPEARAPLYVNTQAFPRAFLVTEYRVMADTDLRAALHAGGPDLAHVALLEQELPPAERPEVSEDAAPGSATFRHHRDTLVELDVQTPTRALLILSDAHYPGWKATVNDEPVTIHRANFALRAVAVPAGSHVVRFQYRPLSVRLGTLVSALTLLGVLGLAWRRTA